MSRTSPTVVMPVGIPVGFGAGIGADVSSLQIRRNGQFISVSAELYDIWWTCRTLQTLDSLATWANHEKLTSFQDSIRWLFDEQLVIGYQNSEIEKLLPALSFIPNGIGTGQDQEDPELCSIRTHDMSVLLHLDPTSYAIWSMSDGSRTIYDTCSELAGGSRSTADKYADAFVQVLGTIVRVNAGFIDVKRAR